MKFGELGRVYFLSPSAGTAGGEDGLHLTSSINEYLPRFLTFFCQGTAFTVVLTYGLRLKKSL